MSFKTVTVACKLPHGMLMQVGEETLHLNGCCEGNSSGDYGLTVQVDADFWQAWLVANKEHDVVMNGLVYVIADTKTSTIKRKVKKKTDVSSL